MLSKLGYKELDEFEILVEVSKQSPDIALGVDKDGAGDQGIMYGYACDETKELMPLPIVLARKIAIKMDELTSPIREVFGADADSGLTGRKIIVDTYGGVGRHGGGAFSGKDCSKVDRLGAYYARYVAKNIVACGIARKCEVQIAYAIGVTKPVAINIDTFGTGFVSDRKIKKVVEKLFSFNPSAMKKEIINDSVCFERLAEYGHVGRSDISLPWEQTNKAFLINKLLR